MSESAQRRRRDEPAMLIGLVEMASGVPAAVYLLATAWTTSVVRSASFVRIETRLGALSLIVALLFIAIAFAGWKLWRGKRIGYGLSAALILPQVIRVVVPGFQFDVYCPISLGIGWILDGPETGLAQVIGYGLSLRLARAPAVPQSCVSINVLALLAVGYLLFRMRRVARGRGRPEVG